MVIFPTEPLLVGAKTTPLESLALYMKLLQPLERLRNKQSNWRVVQKKLIKIIISKNIIYICDILIK